MSVVPRTMTNARVLGHIRKVYRCNNSASDQLLHGSSMLEQLLFQPSTMQQWQQRGKQLIRCIVADNLSCQSLVVYASFGMLKDVPAPLLYKSFADFKMGSCSFPMTFGCACYIVVTVAIYERWRGK